MRGSNPSESNRAFWEGGRWWDTTGLSATGLSNGSPEGLEVEATIEGLPGGGPPLGGGPLATAAPTRLVLAGTRLVLAGPRGGGAPLEGTVPGAVVCDAALKGDGPV